MAIFTVHIPAARAGEAPSAEKIVLLRDGFSIPAMLLGPFWLAWNRAWIPAIGWTALLAVIVFAGVKLGASSADAVAGERRPGLPARLRRLASGRLEPGAAAL